MSWSPAALRKGKATLERRKFGKLTRLGVNAREVKDASSDKHARGKLAVPLAALNGTARVGRPSGLSGAEALLASELRSADPSLWSWRKLAAVLNDQRGAEQAQVSHMSVKRTVERFTAATTV
ncbi:MAG TPA: hypothetical protein VHW01_01030 [Polyangiaceae bacterium]|nr:hypothetical protein [Polyangiaceae bacterium]